MKPKHGFEKGKNFHVGWGTWEEKLHWKVWEVSHIIMQIGTNGV